MVQFVTVEEQDILEEQSYLLFKAYSIRDDDCDFVIGVAVKSSAGELEFELSSGEIWKTCTPDCIIQLPGGIKEFAACLRKKIGRDNIVIFGKARVNTIQTGAS